MTSRIVISLALVLALVACAEPAATVPDGGDGGATSPPAADNGQGEAVEVSINGLAFGQNEITIAAGTSVTWINNDSVPHTVTHGEDGAPASNPLFDEAVAAGEEVSITFDEPGTYSVTCTIHPQMNMTVVVEG